jgi:hypothetical protein
MILSGKNRQLVEQLISKELIFKHCISTWSLAVAATEVAEGYKLFSGTKIDLHDPQIKTRWFDFIRYARRSASLEVESVLAMWAQQVQKEGPNKEYSRDDNRFTVQLDSSVFYNHQYLGPAIIAMPSIEEELMELEGY